MQTDSASTLRSSLVSDKLLLCCCSAFGTRQVLYERYFGGDAMRNAVMLNSRYDKEPMTQWVREFLDRE